MMKKTVIVWSYYATNEGAGVSDIVVTFDRYGLVQIRQGENDTVDLLPEELTAIYRAVMRHKDES